MDGDRPLTCMQVTYYHKQAWKISIWYKKKERNQTNFSIWNDKKEKKYVLEPRWILIDNNQGCGCFFFTLNDRFTQGCQSDIYITYPKFKTSLTNRMKYMQFQLKLVFKSHLNQDASIDEWRKKGILLNTTSICSYTINFLGYTVHVDL